MPPDDPDFDVADGARRYLPALASAFVGHADADLRPGDRVVLVARESSRTQCSPHRQLADLYAAARLRELAVVGAHARVTPGWGRGWLAPAVRLAIDHGAVLLAVSADRLLHSRAYRATLAPPTNADDAQFLTDTAPVRAVTLLHPDAGDDVVRADQTGRGLRGPYTKSELRAGLLPLVRELATRGHGVRAVAGMLLLPRATLSDWLNRPEDGCPIPAPV